MIDGGTNAIAKMNRDQLRRNHSELEQLKQRVNNLNAEDPIDESMPDPIEGISSEEAKAADLAWWEDLKADFEQEPIDPEWGAQTGELFMTDIEELGAEHNFIAVQTDCRSTHCAATVEWPTYGEKQYRSLPSCYTTLIKLTAFAKQYFRSQVKTISTHRIGQQ